MFIMGFSNVNCPFKCLWDTGDIKGKQPPFISAGEFSRNSQFIFFWEINDIVIPSPEKYVQIMRLRLYDVIHPFVKCNIHHPQHSPSLTFTTTFSEM